MALCQKENQINQSVITGGKQNLNENDSNTPSMETAMLRNKSMPVMHTVFQNEEAKHK